MTKSVNSEIGLPGPDDGVEGDGPIPEEEVLQVLFYPEEQDGEPTEAVLTEIEGLVAEARRQAAGSSSEGQAAPAGRVSNASNAASGSDSFQFWTPAEESSLGIGSLVRHTAPDPVSGEPMDTYGIITTSEAKTLGLDDYAIDVYEQNGRPPLDSITPSSSHRRPIFSHKTKVIASTAIRQRPVLSGPVHPVKADELGALHGQGAEEWPGRDYYLLGFYEDADGQYGMFAEERARVLGPKQGHVILSGMPGAGKTSLFLTSVISLYAQLRRMDIAGGSNADGVSTQEHNPNNGGVR